jgi:hypothetical protein
MISKAKQLASITAAGVSAIALTGGKAEAAIIDSGILNTSIIFSSNALPTGSHVVAASRRFATFASGPALQFQALSVKGPSSTYSRRIDMSRGGAKNTSFGIKSRVIGHFPFGATWSVATSHGALVSLDVRRFGPSSSAVQGGPSFTDQYLLFRFNGTDGFDFGWIEASLSVTSSHSSAASDGPNLTIVQYAFDNTGVEITAGELPGTATPEPSSIAESSLAALILGAEGLRAGAKHARRCDALVRCAAKAN